MPLKSDVSEPTSKLGGYLRKMFPSGRNRRILAQIGDRLGSQSPIWRLDADTSSWVRGLIGQAIDYRIRLHFARFQSEHLKMALEGAWAVTRLDDFIGLLRTSPSRFPDYAVTPFGAAPSGSADWKLLCDEETEDGDFSIWRLSTADPDHGPQFSPAFATAEALSANPARTKLNSECILEFFERLEQTVDSVAAHHRLPSASEERHLAQFCLILAVLEAIRRSNWPRLPAFLEANPPSDAESLLAAIPQPWVDDVAGLASSFRHRHADWHGARATLNPTFEGSRDVGGADGDVIVNGCLWDPLGHQDHIEQAGQGDLALSAAWLRPAGLPRQARDRSCGLPLSPASYLSVLEPPETCRRAFWKSGCFDRGHAFGNLQIASNEKAKGKGMTAETLGTKWRKHWQMHATQNFFHWSRSVRDRPH